MTREGLRATLAHPNVAAFLAVIDLGEHGPNADDPDRYRTIYGGEKFDGWEHPRKAVTAGGWTSTAAGRGQFLSKTWDGLVRQYGFPDFSPECQDEAMVALIAGRGALQDVIAGRFSDAIAKCAREWASLPGSPYGQPTLTMDKAKARYLERGGKFIEDTAAPIFDPDTLATEHYGETVTESTVPEEEPMALPIIPLLTAFGPELVRLIPQFASMFGSGSTVQVRNAKAAEMAVSAVVEAVKAPNLQAAIETMQRDPEATKAAQIAAADVLALIEVGGGIDGARKAASSPDQIPPWKNPAVWFMGAFIPLVYGAAYLVLTGEAFSQDAKMMVITAIFSGLLAAGTGFFLGSSLGSQRKTNMIGKE